MVRESCILITKCQTVSKDDFQKLLSTVPVSKNVFNESKSVPHVLVSFCCVEVFVPIVTHILYEGEGPWITVLILEI